MTTVTVKTKLLQRMTEMVTEAEAIQTHAGTQHRQLPLSLIDSRHRSHGDIQAYKVYSAEGSVLWLHNFKSLMAQVVNQNSPHWGTVQWISVQPDPVTVVDQGRLMLIALKADLERGLLDPIINQVQTEISADYMGMAERLLKEDAEGSHEHIPAAVLAGAVLERGLRELCSRQSPPIATTKTSGDHKMMNLLIDDLKAVNAFKEPRAKHLRAWASVRNAAAHGEFEKFNRNDVEQMIAGVMQFLADHL